MPSNLNRRAASRRARKSDQSVCEQARDPKSPEPPRAYMAARRGRPRRDKYENLDWLLIVRAEEIFKNGLPPTASIRAAVEEAWLGENVTLNGIIGRSSEHDLQERFYEAVRREIVERELSERQIDRTLHALFLQFFGHRIHWALGANKEQVVRRVRARLQEENLRFSKGSARITARACSLWSHLLIAKYLELHHKGQTRVRVE